MTSNTYGVGGGIHRDEAIRIERLNDAISRGDEDVCIPDDLDMNVTGLYGISPLHMAAKKRRNDLVGRLLAHGGDDIDINIKDMHGNTPLHHIARFARKDDAHLVEMFLKRDDIDVNAKNEYGDTPLHVAVTCGNREMIDRLLVHAKIDVGVVKQL